MLGIPSEKGGIKKLFIAPKGFLLMEDDSSQHEIRTLGALANDRQMISDFVNKIDFHGAARNRIYGRGFSKANYTHQEVLDAKTMVFGPIYGRGAVSVAEQLYASEIAPKALKGEKVIIWSQLPRQDQWKWINVAQGYIDKLWAPYPTSLQYMRDRMQEAHDTGEVLTYYGFRRRWGLITEENVHNVENEARNTPIQCTANYTNLLVMLALSSAYPRDILVPLLPVHDSILSRIKEEGAIEVARGAKKFCEKKAQELLNTEMLFEYEVTIGKSWGEQEEVK